MSCSGDVQWFEHVVLELLESKILNAYMYVYMYMCVHIYMYIDV